LLIRPLCPTRRTQWARSPSGQQKRDQLPELRRGPMRRVRWVTLLVLVSVWLGGAVPSAAGGGSTFQFRRMWFAPGQVVGAATEFSDWAGAQASVADGPWFAYLI